MTALPAPASKPGSHLWARELVRQGFKAEIGREGTPTEIQAIQSVGLHEGSYGLATKPAAWQGSNNWGAIMSTTRPDAQGGCPPGTFATQDYDARSDKKFLACFKKYATPADGARDLVRHMTKIRPLTGKAIGGGDLDEIADTMFREHYYGGFGKTIADRKANYAAALLKAATAIGAGTGEGVLLRRGEAAKGSSSSGALSGLVVVAGLGLVVLAASRRAAA